MKFQSCWASTTKALPDDSGQLLFSLLLFVFQAAHQVLQARNPDFTFHSGLQERRGGLRQVITEDWLQFSELAIRQTAHCGAFEA